jgi:mRNA-degrading endonuclease RelE of RelBE toxin-antitoxin system
MKRVPVFLTTTAHQLLRHLHPDLKRLIRQALDELANHPMKGKPLQEELAGLWSLRVSHYRIIYQLGACRENLGARDGQNVHKQLYSHV